MKFQDSIYNEVLCRIYYEVLCRISKMKIKAEILGGSLS
jgi:hypothetical protein